MGRAAPTLNEDDVSGDCCCDAYPHDHPPLYGQCTGWWLVEETYEAESKLCDKCDYRHEEATTFVPYGEIMAALPRETTCTVEDPAECPAVVKARQDWVQSC